MWIGIHICPDPGSALAFMRFRIQMQIRIQGLKTRLEKLKGKQKNVHGKYLNFQFKFSAFFASGFGSIKSPVILILVTDYYSAADSVHNFFLLQDPETCSIAEIYTYVFIRPWSHCSCTGSQHSVYKVPVPNVRG